MALPVPKNQSRRKSRRRSAYLEILESRLLMSAVNSANVAWSTYFGGPNDEEVVGPAAIAIDANGNKIVGGWTESLNLPNANNASIPNAIDACVAKYDPQGTLLWSTFIGGTNDATEGLGVAVDAAGNTFITGFTQATDLTGALNAAYGNRDAFLAKVSAAGNLLWSLYLGGSADDAGRSVAVDGSGNAYVTGYTLSSDFAGPSGIASGIYGGNKDAFVAKVAPNGTLLSARYFGGSGDDDAGRIVVSPAGDFMIAGNTSSTNLDHATNAYHGGSSDAYVAKFDASGNVQWATYLGGSGAEAVSGGDSIISTALAWDANGTAFVAGYTESANLPLAKNKYAGNGDGFVCAVDSTGTLLWSLYLGAGATDAAADVAIDRWHNVIVTGLMGFTSVTGTSMNAMVAKISPSGTLDWLRQFGGSKNDFAASVALDSAGNAWIAGSTWSNDLPVANNTAPGGNLTVDPNRGTPYDTFLAKINASSMSQATRLVISDLPVTLSAGHVPALHIQVQYPSGAMVTEDSSTVTLTLLNANGATLNGTTSAPVIGGVATFSDLALTRTGSYTLLLTDGTLTAKSVKFSVTPDVSTGHLLLAQSPGATVVGKTLSPKLVIHAVDQYGNVIPTEHSKIILATTSGAFTGASTVTLSRGSAAFSNLIFKTAGSYTLTAAPATNSTLALTTPIAFVQTISQATTNAIPAPALKPGGYTFATSMSLATRLTSNAPSSIAFTGIPRLVIIGAANIVASSFSAAGVMKFTLPVLTVGSYTCQIRYPGDSNHSSSITPPFTLVINKAPTTTTLTTSPGSLVFGQTLTLTATVKSATTPNIARTGSIEFLDNGVPLQTILLNASSSASLSFVPSSTGSHSYQAVYLGDTDFMAGNSPLLTRSVSKDKTSILLTPSMPGLIAHNQTFNLDIHVAVLAPGNSPLTGDLVTIKDNGKVMGTLTLDSAGNASLAALSYTASGTHHVQALFTGDGTTLPMTSATLTLLVT